MKPSEQSAVARRHMWEETHGPNIESLSRQGFGASTIATRLRLPPPRVSAYLETRGLPRHGSHQVTRVWSDDELVTVLRKAAGDAGRVSAGAYAVWRETNDGPCVTLFYHRFGSWKEACRQAGLRTNRGRVEYGRVWSVEGCVLRLARWVTETDGPFTASEWNRYSQATPDAPSLGTVRLRCGSWSAAINEARHRTKQPV